ncbi:Uma2 family endonuclease [Hymenobacter sp.]|jgi:Uma2 family endonuclease|uniref:Uma2 family endonuclease n=1 Tax=Hymenobacter sp. TaxID=1898978 RepID=UPI002ED917E6
MQTQAIEVIETEVVLEEAMSFNHSRLTYRLSVLLSAYEDKYDILPELEFELSAGRLKPDVAILLKQEYNWEKDVIRFPSPPITAIEILSPTQSLDFLIAKIREGYFPSGTQSAWLVVPSLRSIYLFLPNQAPTIVTSGVLRDPACGVEVAIDAVFR